MIIMLKVNPLSLVEFLALCFGVTGFQYILLIIWMSILYKQKNLIKWGRTAEAMIIDIKERVAPKGGKYTMVTYRFTDADGKIVQGEGGPLRPNLNLIKFTNNPTVVYDPHNSAKNLLYPADGVVCYPPP
jgi:hypothetical protein